MAHIFFYPTPAQRFEIPKDVFLKNIIEPFFNEKELYIAAHVCKAWRAALKDKLATINALKTHIQCLTENGQFQELVSFKDKDNSAPIFGFISANPNTCIFRRHAYLTIANSAGNMKIITDATRILCEIENIVLFSDQNGTKLTGIDKHTGCSLFILESKDLKELGKISSAVLHILNIHLVSKSPDFLLMVFEEGIVTKVELKNQKLGFIESFNVGEKKKGNRIAFSAYYEERLFVTETTNEGTSYSLYCCKTGKKIDTGNTFRELLAEDIDYSSAKYPQQSNFFAQNVAAVEGQLIITGKDKVLCCNLQTGKINWEIDTSFMERFVMPPTPTLTIFYCRRTYFNGTSRIIPTITSTVTGKQIRELQYYDDSNLLVAAKVFGPLLFVVYSKKIQIFLQADKKNPDVRLLASWYLLEDFSENLKILDVAYDGKSLFLLLKDTRGHIYVKTKNIQGIYKDPWPTFQKITQKKETLLNVSLLSTETSVIQSSTVEPQEEISPATVNEDSSVKLNKSSTKTKVMAVALGIFTVLVLSGAALAYYRGAINLSIGLGITSIVSGSLAGILGTNHYLNQRNLRHLDNSNKIR